ncbi:MAG: tetratricopeptide repeat protein, partial [Bryobacteraceae bacterium]
MKFALILLAGLPVLAQTSTPEQCAELRHHGDPAAKECYRQLTQSRDLEAQAEGYWGLRDYQASFNAFVAEEKQNPNDPRLHVRFGRMLLEHWQPGDATDEFGRALKIKPDYAPALLGEALAAAQAYGGNAEELARKALESDPKLVEAQELIARIALEDNNEPKASAEAKKALGMSKEALDGMAILGTIDLLDDKKESPWFQQILKINPRYGEAYETAGHFFFINRRYDEEIEA